MLSVVYHNLDLVEKRDDVAGRHAETQALQLKQEAVIIEDDLQQIFDLVNMVGAALASR